jgi:hypothetical protein
VRRARHGYRRRRHGRARSAGAGTQAINFYATGPVARSCKVNLGGHVGATALRLGYPTVFRVGDQKVTQPVNTVSEVAADCPTVEAASCCTAYGGSWHNAEGLPHCGNSGRDLRYFRPGLAIAAADRRRQRKTLTSYRPGSCIAMQHCLGAACGI